MNDKPIDKVAIVGSGTMGEGIAISFAQAGFTVKLLEIDQERLSNCLVTIKSNLELFDEFDLLEEDPSSVAKRIHGIVPQDIIEESQDCGCVVETVPEVLEIKKSVFKQLDHLPTDIILCSNTSSITVNALTDQMKSAERVVGLHYFNPAHIIPAVEIHRGDATTDEVVTKMRELMLRCGKKPVLVRKSVPGFIINRLTGAMEREIDYLLDEGVVTPEDLDTAVKASYGFRLACLGPMEAEDLIGLDISARVSGNIFKVLSNKTEPSPDLLEKVKKGELGVKSKKGWYDYSGKTSAEIANNTNRKLLKQLVHFKNI